MDKISGTESDDTGSNPVAILLSIKIFRPVAQRKSRGLLSLRLRFRNSPGLPFFILINTDILALYATIT